MLSLIRAAIPLVLLFMTCPALAYKVKCNKTQNLCEVDTTRLTIGDKVGIFSEDGDLVALGEVKTLKGRIRVVDIKKKYGPILRSHNLEMVKDEEYDAPAKYFKVLKKGAEQSAGGSLGLVSLGVGEGFLGFQLDGFMEWLWQNGIFVFGQGFFISGKGNATITEEAINEDTIAMSVIGALGGVSYTGFRNREMSFRGDLGLGFANVSASTGSGRDVKEVADGRIFPGMGFVMRGEAAMLWTIGDWRPYISGSFIRLQNSNNYGVSLGVLMGLK